MDATNFPPNVLLNELEDDRDRLKYSIENFSGKKGGSDYKELIAKLKQLTIDVYKIQSEDEFLKTRIEVVINDIGKLYRSLQKSSSTAKILDGVVTYFLDEEEKINLGDLPNTAEVLKEIVRELAKLKQKCQQENLTDTEKQGVKKKLNSLMVTVKNLKTKDLHEYRCKGELLNNIGEMLTTV